MITAGGSAGENRGTSPGGSAVPSEVLAPSAEVPGPSGAVPGLLNAPMRPGAVSVESARDLVELVGALGVLPAPATEAEAIDRVRALEELKAACAAAQVVQTEALHTLRCDEEASRGVPAAERGRGVAAEVALARRESSARGAQGLRLARTLVADMPCTLRALRQGSISEYKASVMVKETSWLPAGARGEVDALMAQRLEVLGPQRLGGEARAHAQRLDPAAAVRHTDRAVTERRVSVRPAPGGMAYLTALLPVGQAVACLATLKKSAATTTGGGGAGHRTQAQIMADLLVERITGQHCAADVPVEVHLVMTDGALLGGEDAPGWLVGHGPVPAGVARTMVGTTEAEVFLRRLYTAPATGQLVGMDSRRRQFSGLLRRLVILRDDSCRTPWCDAPIKHIDHATPHRHGGATSFDNASGLCARCNYVKENPGWEHRATADGLDVVTPTGHRYTHPAGSFLPPLIPERPVKPPGPDDRDVIAVPEPVLVFPTDPELGKDRAFGHVIPMEAADVQVPTTHTPKPISPYVAVISLQVAHLARYLASI